MLKVSKKGTVKATNLKKITAGKQEGLKPTYFNTTLVHSFICRIDKGILQYKDYLFEEIAERSTFIDDLLQTQPSDRPPASNYHIDAKLSKLSK